MFYRCDNENKPCQGKFIFNLSTGDEAWKGHTLSRIEHNILPKEEEEHLQVKEVQQKKVKANFSNERLAMEIESLVTNNPSNATPDAVLATLGDKYPELKFMSEYSLRYQLSALRKKYLPNDGRIIHPEKTRSLSGGALGREYITHEMGDYFIMYSDFQEDYIEMCKNDTTHLMIDGTFRCVPPEYVQVLICVLYSYEKDFFMPIFQCFMSNKELNSYVFVLGNSFI